MILVALDLETTGLNPRRDQVLQVAAVAFDSRDLSTPVDALPSFNYLVRHDRYEGDAFALQMNAAILKRLAAGEGVDQLTVSKALIDWVHERCGKDDRGRWVRPHPVGHNVAAFDCAFLGNLMIPCRDLFHHRPIELGSLHCTLDGPATSNQLAARLQGREPTHDALRDCWDAVEAWRDWARGRST